MKRFEYFEHTADTLFKAYGKTWEETYTNLIMAVYNVIVDTEVVQERETRDIIINAPKQETLVYELISELIMLLDTESFLVHEVTKLHLEQTQDNWQLTATLAGDTKSHKYDVFGQIKSATYHELELGTADGYFFIQAVLDL
jgi:SHS2 domain-containing protein